MSFWLILINFVYLKQQLLISAGFFYFLKFGLYFICFYLLFSSFCWLWALFALLFLVPLDGKLGYLRYFLCFELDLNNYKFPSKNSFCCVS